MIEANVDNNGFYGEYGGQYVAETLIPALEQLDDFFKKIKNNKNFLNDLNKYFSTYIGRPTPVYFAENLSKKTNINIYLKREDLLHTGAHKINNTIGQALMTKYMGKSRIIAETGAGQHGVATATAAALFDLDCTVYMGRIDAERQALNVKRMKMLGAEVKIVSDGTETLKDAVSASLKDWITNVQNTHYLIGTVAGAHPLPEIVSWFHSVIGEESKQFFEEKGVIPDAVVACVGGGSNAIGIFRGFLDDNVKLYGVEAGGKSNKIGENARTLAKGRKGIFQGSLSYVVQDDNSQIIDVYSISAGLDYPGIGPEHSYLKSIGRANYVSCSDEEAMEALFELLKTEGILPALESSHALGYVLANSEKFKNENILICLSGRGDKDLTIIEDYIGREQL
jgi:tryptophan synthase beta chain